MNTNEKGAETVRIAVIGKEGQIQYHELPPQENTKTDCSQGGQVVYAFHSKSVHSDAWKACDHTQFEERKRQPQ